MNALKCFNLEKSYGKVKALRGLSFSVPEGSITGMLGPNGAGKSTTIKIINGLIANYRGSVEAFGRKVENGDYEYRNDIGYVPEDFSLYEYMKGSEILHFNSELVGNGGKNAIKKLQDLFRLPLERRISSYSRGMRKLLSLYLAIQGNPRLLILDEPTDGLDPVVRSKFFDILLKLVTDYGVTILFSSHILSEVEKICDRVVFVNKGKVVLEEEIDLLKENSALIITKGGETPKNIPVETEGDFKKIFAVGNVNKVLKFVEETGGKVEKTMPLTFEQIFIKFVEVNDESGS